MNMIHQYIDDPRTGMKVGIIAATKHHDVVYISAAKTNTSHGDRFSKQIGRDIVTRRLDSLIAGRQGGHGKIPASMADALPPFMERCEKYFETDAIVIPTIDSF